MAEVKKLNILTEDVTGENIQDVIRDANIITDDIAKEAGEKIAKQRKEKLTQELVEVVQKCEYTVKSTVLQTRRSNRTNQRIKAYLKELSELADTVKNGKAPVTDWDSKAPELKKQLDKDLTEIGKEIDESQSQLDGIFPNSWSYRYANLIPGGRR